MFIKSPRKGGEGSRKGRAEDKVSCDVGLVTASANPHRKLWNKDGPFELS